MPEKSALVPGRQDPLPPCAVPGNSPDFFPDTLAGRAEAPGRKTKPWTDPAGWKANQPWKFKDTTVETARRKRNNSRERQDKRLFKVLNTPLCIRVYPNQSFRAFCERVGCEDVFLSSGAFSEAALPTLTTQPRVLHWRTSSRDSRGGFRLKGEIG